VILDHVNFKKTIDIGSYSQITKQMKHASHKSPSVHLVAKWIKRENDADANLYHFIIYGSKIISETRCNLCNVPNHT